MTGTALHSTEIACIRHVPIARGFTGRLTGRAVWHSLQGATGPGTKQDQEAMPD